MTDNNAKPAEGAAAATPHRSWIALIDRWFGRLTAVMNVIGTATIVIITVIVVIDVVGTLLNHPLIGVNEFMQLSLPGIVFLQLANTLREDRQVSSDVLINGLRQRKPRTTKFIFSFYNIVGAIFMGYLAWLMYPKALQAYTENFTRGAQGIIEIPQWPSMALVVLGSAVMAIQYLIHAIRDFMAGANGDFVIETGAEVKV